MGEYDLLVKDLLRRKPPTMMSQMGVPSDAQRIETDVSSKGKERFVDYLARDSYGNFFHVEFQTYNDPQMPFRMLEYFTMIAKSRLTEIGSESRDNRITAQGLMDEMAITQRLIHLVRYHGQSSYIYSKSSLTFSYEETYACEMNSEDFIDSTHSSDLVFAILCKFDDLNSAPRTILKRLEEIVGSDNHFLALCGELLVFARLRGIGSEVERELSDMNLVVEVKRDGEAAPRIRRALDEMSDEHCHTLRGILTRSLGDQADYLMSEVNVFLEGQSFQNLAKLVEERPDAQRLLELAHAHSDPPTPGHRRSRRG